MCKHRTALRSSTRKQTHSLEELDGINLDSFSYLRKERVVSLLLFCIIVTPNPRDKREKLSSY